MSIKNLTNVNYLTAVPPSLTRPFLIFYWAKAAADGTSKVPYDICVFGQNQQRRTSILNASNLVETTERDATGVNSALSTLTFADNAWTCNYNGWIAANSRKAGTDGGNIGTNTTTRNPTAPADFLIGRASQGTLFLGASNEFACMSIWDGNLLSSEIDTLYALLATVVGLEAPDARDVNEQVGQPHTGKLLHYLIFDDETDLNDKVGTLNFSAVGTILQGSNPPVHNRDIIIPASSWPFHLWQS